MAIGTFYFRYNFYNFKAMFTKFKYVVTDIFFNRSVIKYTFSNKRTLATFAFWYRFVDIREILKVKLLTYTL